MLCLTGGPSARLPRATDEGPCVECSCLSRASAWVRCPLVDESEGLEDLETSLDPTFGMSGMPGNGLPVLDGRYPTRMSAELAETVVLPEILLFQPASPRCCWFLRASAAIDCEPPVEGPDLGLVMAEVSGGGVLEPRPTGLLSLDEGSRTLNPVTADPADLEDNELFRGPLCGVICSGGGILSTRTPPTF